MKFNEYKKQIYNKAYVSSRASELAELLDSLRSALFYYIRIYKQLKFTESNQDKYDDLEAKITDAQNKIKDLLQKINDFFNEGFFFLNLQKSKLMKFLMNINV